MPVLAQFATFATVKIICWLLSFYVILLSARPCCVNDQCNSSPSENTEQRLPNKDCNGCSPFYACGTCTGFVTGQQLTYGALLFTDAPEQHYVPYSQPYLQQVALAIWQPPKIS